MKKLISIFILISLSASLFSQSKKATFLIVKTSRTSEQTGEHISISTIPSSSTPDSPTIIIHVLAPEKGIRENFIHANYPCEESSQKKTMTVKMISLSVFEKIKSIDLNLYLEKSDKKKFRNFCMKLRNNPIYMIDRNDINNDSIKAIEVEYIRHLQY